MKKEIEFFEISFGTLFEANTKYTRHNKWLIIGINESNIALAKPVLPHISGKEYLGGIGGGVDARLINSILGKWTMEQIKEAVILGANIQFRDNKSLVDEYCISLFKALELEARKPGIKLYKSTK